jgi:hypothetical protein
MSWHGYILIEQPAALDVKAWPDVMKALGARWNTTPANPEWCKRIAVRYSLDGTKAIVESNFDTDDLVTSDEAKFASVVSIASKGALTAKAAATMFQGKLKIFEGKTQMESAQACRNYLAAHRDEWESDVELTVVDKVLAAASRGLKRLITPENEWLAQGLEW